MQSPIVNGGAAGSAQQRPGAAWNRASVAGGEVEGLALTKKAVGSYVRAKGSKQICQAVQPARGKTVAESLDARFMMDLVAFCKAAGDGGR